MDAKADFSEVQQFAVQLNEALAAAPDEVAKVVYRGAFTIQEDARARAKRIGPHVRRYPGTITFETARHGAETAAEIGPETSRGQGALGDILENGSPTSPPHPHMLPAGEAERPRFERALEDLAVRLLEGP
ncbi:hypothetical protein [Micromonospora chersina]|uniref:hypothetical protein n=1 Tax=Micromonospora chersina TaxID=47854 RepID=UPI0034113D5C